MRELPWGARAYVTAVVITAVVLLALGDYSGMNSWATLAVLALLFLVCESVPALLNVRQAAVSLSFSASLAAVVLLGPGGAALTGAVAVFSIRPGLAVLKRVYNGAQFALLAYVAGEIYVRLGGQVGVPRPSDSFAQLIGPYAAAATSFVLLNFVLMGFLLRLTGQGSFLQDMRWRGVAQLLLSYLGYATFGLLIAGLWTTVYSISAILVLLPLFIARWAFGQYLAQQRAYDATIAALCQAVETKDAYTRGHGERVSKASVMLAEEVGMGPERVAAIRYAGMLHDVGKLGVPTKVLQKEGALTEEEYAAIQLHPMRGLEIVRGIDFLDEAYAGIMHHHERIDGRGYPMGLAGDEIPEFARVLCVADAFDSMTSDRSYRGARSVPEAVAELRRGAGTQFDADLVAAFVEAIEREGWEPPRRVEPDTAEDTAVKDHDDPTAPIQVVSDRGSGWTA